MMNNVAFFRFTVWKIPISTSSPDKQHPYGNWIGNDHLCSPRDSEEVSDIITSVTISVSILL